MALIDTGQDKDTQTEKQPRGGDHAQRGLAVSLADELALQHYLLLDSVFMDGSAEIGGGNVAE
jgi:hypothetical protein